MAWDDKILGGVGIPHFLFIEDENLCSNPSVETNLTGWAAGTGVTLERVSDENVWHGDYCMRVSADTSSIGLAYYEITADASEYAGETLVIRLLARAEENQRRLMYSIVYDDGGNTWEREDKYIGPEWEMFSMVVEIPLDASGALKFGFSANEYGHRYQEQFTRVDDVRIYKVNKQYNLPQPQFWLQTFDKIVKNRM